MSEPIRVLQVVTQMNRAGLESRLMDIYRHIDRTKVQFDFYTFRLDKGAFDDEIITLGGRIYYTEPINISGYCFIPKRLTSFFLAHSDYRIVHCHMNQWCGIILKGAADADVPVRIAHSRTALSGGGLKNKVKNIIKLRVNRYATHRFAVSQKAGEWLFGKSEVQKGSVRVWPNAIDCRKYKYDEVNRQTIRKELGIENKSMILHVGNFTLPKNHTFLIDIFSEVRKVDHTAILCLVGGGDDRLIKEKVERLGLTKDVIFTGVRSDVPKLLSAADIFVFPSLYEGFPGAVLEAQVAGLQCIISDSITQDICVLDSVTQLPLKLGAKVWAEYIVGKCHERVVDAFERIACTDYEITTMVEQLTEFYEVASRRRGVMQR